MTKKPHLITTLLITIVTLTGCDVQIQNDEGKTKINVTVEHDGVIGKTAETFDKIKKSRGVAEFKRDAKNLIEKVDQTDTGRVFKNTYHQIIEDFTEPAEAED